MDKYKDKAITIVQTLMNATGAEFEDENMAIDIIAGNLKIEEENYADLHDVSGRFLHINDAAKLIKSMPTEQAIQNMKAALSGRPKSTVIDGNLLIYLNVR